MTRIADAIDVVKRAAEAEGLPAFARRSGVPYTTLRDWQRAGWRPSAVATLEKLIDAANDTLPQSEAA